MDIISDNNGISNSIGNAIDSNSLHNSGLNDIDLRVRSDLFANSEVLQQSSFFQEIFNDPASQSLVDNFTNNQASAGKVKIKIFELNHCIHSFPVVSDLAETMQSLQTIAEQYLPESWENDNQICPINTEETSNSFNLIENIYKCQFCGESFKGNFY